MMLHLNTTAPDFKLYDTKRELISLSSLRGKKVVVAFFPAAFTGVCERELCTFRDAFASFDQLNATVLGISVDGPFANAAFVEKNQINFPVLSDFRREAVAAYGVNLGDFAGLKGYTAAQRSVFVVGEEGQLIYEWIADNAGIEPDYDAVKAACA
jgi:peroxiredoxin